MNTNIIILAAGKGTRMNSSYQNKAKVSYEILGKPLIHYVIEACQILSPDQIITVVGFGGENTTELVKDYSKAVWQKEQKGTGHAVQIASELIPSTDGVTVILCGDSPLICAKTLQKAFENHVNKKNDLTILSALINERNNYGKIKRDANSKVIGIVEDKDSDESQKDIREVNSGIYFVNNSCLKRELKKLKPNNVQDELYLTDIVEFAINDEYIVNTFQLDDYKEMLGINDRLQLAEASNIMKKRINDEHMRNGVTIIDPENTYIGKDVLIARDNVIYPGTYMVGKCSIDMCNEIGPNTYLSNSSIGKGNKVISSYLYDSRIGDENEIGPMAKFRAGTEIGNHCRAGNFVEFKNVIFHDGAKAAHLTYLGDTEVGERTNIGCGVISANYDGFNKTRTYIGKDCFVGSNVTLIAPIVIEDGAFLAAGSTINKNVPKNDFAIARDRQTNKKEYATVFRNKAKAIKEGKK